MLITQRNSPSIARRSPWVVKAFVVIVLLIIWHPVAFAQFSPNTLRLWVANSAAQTGLIPHLATVFQTLNPGVEIKINHAGALQVLDEARDGKADIVITHFPNAEQLFLSQDHGISRVLLMYNEFALFGPKEDPLQIQNTPDLLESLRILAKNEVDFLVPGTRSGTYKKLAELWSMAKVVPEWIGHESTNASAKSTLQTADMTGKYSFADMGTYLSLKNELTGDIIPLYRDHILLQNNYSAIVVNKTKHRDANEILAHKFLDYLISAAGQKEIENFGPNTFGTKLFTAAAHLDPGLVNRKLMIDTEKKTRELQGIILLLLITVVFVLTVSWFISRLRKKEQQQRMTEERFRITVTGTNDGIWDWNIKQNTVYLSPRFKEILTISAKSNHYADPLGLLELYLDKNYHDDVIGKLKNYIDKNRYVTVTEIFKSECRVTVEDGRVLWLALRGKLLSMESEIFMVGSIQEVTHEREQNAVLQKMEYQAMHDVLTGLPNRTLLYDRLQRAVVATSRNRNGFALMVIDLDKFKPVNDNYGHRAGDAALKLIAESISCSIRKTDTVARVGGDEFVVVLNNVDKASAIRTAWKIHDAVCLQNIICGIPLQVGASIGIALYPVHEENIEKLIQYADQAMYAAKHNGAGVTMFGETQKEEKRLAKQS